MNMTRALLASIQALSALTLASSVAFFKSASSFGSDGAAGFSALASADSSARHGATKPNTNTRSDASTGEERKRFKGYPSFQVQGARTMICLAVLQPGCQKSPGSCIRPISLLNND